MNLRNKDLIKMMLFSVILLCVGCSVVEEPIPEDQEGISFVLNTGAGENFLVDGENAIKSVRIIAFDGQFLDINELYTDAQLEVTQDGITIKRVIVSLEEGKQIYFIVNEPAGLKTQLDQLLTTVQLERIEYQVADYFTNTAFNIAPTNTAFKSLPMSGFLQIDGFPTGTYPITISRALARVDIHLRGAADGFYLDANSGLTYNTASGGILLEGILIPNSTTESKTLAVNKFLKILKTDYVRAFTYYTPERQNISPNRLKFRITQVRQSGVEGPKDLLELDLAQNTTNGKPMVTVDRNTIYSVYCTIQASGEVSFTYLVEPWLISNVIVPPFE